MVKFDRSRRTRGQRIGFSGNGSRRSRRCNKEMITSDRTPFTAIPCYEGFLLRRSSGSSCHFSRLELPIQLVTESRRPKASCRINEHVFADATEIPTRTSIAPWNFYSFNRPLPFRGKTAWILRDPLAEFPPAERSRLVSSTKGGRAWESSSRGKQWSFTSRFSTSKCFYTGFKKVGEDLSRLRNFEISWRRGKDIFGGQRIQTISRVSSDSCLFLSVPFFSRSNYPRSDSIFFPEW